jgi:hypothetical protein
LIQNTGRKDLDELLNLHPQGVIKLDMVDYPLAAKKFIENLKSSEALALDKSLRNCIETVIDHLKSKLPRQILEICK